MSMEEQQERIAKKTLECQIFILQNPPVYTNSEYRGQSLVLWSVFSTVVSL